MSTTSVDQRRHPRHRIRVPLYISVEGDTYRKMIPVQSSDVSAGGIGFDTSRELPMDGSSRLVLSRIGGLPADAEIQGRVVRCRKDPETGRYSIGVAFTELVGVSEEELVASLARMESAAAS